MGGKYAIAKRQYMALKAILEAGAKNKNHNRRARSLAEQGLIYLSGVAIELTDRGKELLRNYHEKELEITRPQQWDGVWRVVVYDIPIEFSTERKYFREKLKELGFVMIQKSVWAHPFECKEEIAILAKEYRVAPFVIVLNTNRLPNQSKLRRHFSI